MKYFIFTLLFALEVLGQNTRVLPRGISIPAGSVLVGNSTGVGTSTPAGTTGQVLISNGTSTPPSWGTVLTNPMTTLGDMVYGGSTGTPSRRAIGSSLQRLTVVSGVPSWQNKDISGEYVTYSAIVSCTTGGSSITSNNGLVSSIATRGAVGCTVTLNSGLFSAAPACSVTRTGAQALPAYDATSATSINIYVSNTSGTFLDFSGAIICSGTKP